MKIVKLSINSPKEGLLRQTPNGDGIWNNFKFIINEDISECDFWVVYSKGEKENNSTFVAPENMIFISGEPEPIYHYANKFIKCFNTIVTTRNDIKHKNIFYSQPAQPWWIGRVNINTNRYLFNLGFNDIDNSSPIKSKTISVITSNKGFSKGHIDRIRFVKKLKSHFKDKLDVYGKGINSFNDKWQIVKDYKYHIAIENSSYNHYWTEKLADSYLANCFPLYYGAKNLDEYFPKDSYQYIDLYDLPKSIKVIERAISENKFEINKAFVAEAKQKILYEYNIFPLIVDICDNMNASLPKKEVRIKHEMSYFDIHKISLLMKRMYYKYIY